MATHKKTFQQWRSEINSKIDLIFGIGIDDLEDMPYHQWYEDGLSVSSAVSKIKKMVREEYGFGA